MKKILIFLLVFTTVTLSANTDVFDVHSEQWSPSAGGNQSAMNRVGEHRPIASPVTGYSYNSDVDAINIIRDARVKAIEYTDKVEQAKEGGRKDLAEAYQQCSNALNMIAKGFEERNEEIISKGRADFRAADAKVNSIAGETYNKIGNPQYQFTTIGSD